MNDQLTLFAASDERLLFGLATLVRSVRSYLDESCVLNVYIYLDAVSRRDKMRFVTFCADEMSNVRLELVSTKDFSTTQNENMKKLMRERARGWRAMLSRIFLPSLLPASSQRAIYADADAIALKDLSEVNTVALDDFAVGAVRAPLSKMHSRLPSVPAYFNSGVLIVDLPKWRAEDIEERCVDWLLADDPKNFYADQDALNCVLCSDGRTRWKSLSPVWNAIGVGIEDRAKTEYAAPELKDVKILHFAGSHKPWYPDGHPFGGLFFEHFVKTPFKIPADIRNRKGFSGRLALVLRRLRRGMHWS